MSYQVTRFVLQLNGLSPAEKSVLHSLAYHAHADGGNSWPSMAVIANEAGLSGRRSAQRIVRRMEERGILVADTSKKGGRHTPTTYRFNLEYSDRGVALSEQETATAETQKSDPPVALSRRNSDPGDTKQRPPGRPKGYKRSLREREKGTAAALSPANASPVGKENRDFDELEVAMVNIKAPRTPQTEKIIRAALAEGADPADIWEAIMLTMRGMPKTERQPGLYLAQNLSGELKRIEQDAGNELSEFCEETAAAVSA